MRTSKHFLNIMARSPRTPREHRYVYRNRRSRSRSGRTGARRPGGLFPETPPRRSSTVDPARNWDYRNAIRMLQDPRFWSRAFGYGQTAWQIAQNVDKVHSRYRYWKRKYYGYKSTYRDAQYLYGKARKYMYNPPSVFTTKQSTSRTRSRSKRLAP